MKQLASLFVGAASAFLLLYALGWRSSPSSPAAATPTASSPTCPWPDSLDAVAAAPANHRVVLENEHVRVLDVTVQPGEREPLHAHCRSSVMYLMYEGIYKDYGPGDELLSEVSESPSDAQYPMTLWVDPQGPHAVHNLDSRAVRLLRVEIKEPVR